MCHGQPSEEMSGLVENLTGNQTLKEYMDDLRGPVAADDEVDVEEDDDEYNDMDDGELGDDDEDEEE